jgi:hypothetical protein
METTEVSETSVSKTLTPGKYPKESTLHSYVVLGYYSSTVFDEVLYFVIVSVDVQDYDRFAFI